MPLDDTYPKSVVFVMGWRDDDETGARAQEPIGTAFFVDWPTVVPGRSWVYLVTARHVVECEDETWVRVRMKDGSLQTLAVPTWTKHPKDDVAVAFFDRPAEVSMTFISSAKFLDVWRTRPTLGDRVYFIGLLSGVTSMARENVPMVRSGTLGRLYQDDVLLRRCDKVDVYQQAHLIDCRSYAGFSGSPCFVQFHTTQKDADPSRPGAWLGGVSIVPDTICIGLISGHLDDMARVAATGEMANDQMARDLRFPTNTGVGVVTPVERIRECLMDDELVADRAARDARLVETERRKEKEKAATPDSRGGPSAGMTRGEFEDALRKVSRRKPSQPDEGTSGTSE